MEITPRHWLIALLIAGLAHAALALALVHQSAPRLALAPGITIELGDGGQPGAAGSGAASGLAALQPVESRDPSLSAASIAAPVDVQGSATEADPLVSDRIQEVAPEDVILAKAVPKLNRTPTPEPRLKPRPKAEQPQARTREAPTAPSRSELPSKPPSASSATARANPRSSPAARSTAASTPGPSLNQPDRSGRGESRHRAGAGDGDGNGNRSDGAAGTGGSGSGSEASASNYYGRLATWLARHKRYPIQARRLRQEGVVKVTFTIASNGRVVSKQITQSSGHDLLDQEVQAMLKRASPLPRIPSSLGRSSLTVTLPVAFNLR